MFSFHSNFRRFFTPALALLVVAAVGHCAWESSIAVQQLAAAASLHAASPSLPLSTDHGCHNESGCICRGATPATAASVAHLQATLQDLLPPVLPLSGHADAQCTCHALIDLVQPPAALSGRQLRALYASLLI